jgi:uncharacterized membrane protein YqiK
MTANGIPLLFVLGPIVVVVVFSLLGFALFVATFARRASGSAIRRRGRTCGRRPVRMTRSVMRPTWR